MEVYSAFTIVNEDFKLGGNVDRATVQTLPKPSPHQLFFVSSASSTETPFYSKYREYAKEMILGNPDYVVLDVNCELAINATVEGKIYPKAPLKRETVEQAMKVDKQRALREYYNQFAVEGGANAIIKRAWITRNSVVRPPVLSNDGSLHKIVAAYDPARNTDDSVVAFADLYEDPKKGWMMDIINVVSFADLGLKKKTPMRIQEQIVELRSMLLGYNGKANDYDNIEILLVDAGSGGGGNSWVRDLLIENWTDRSGTEHKGLIDKEYSSEYIRRFPEAINKLRLIEPTKYKSEAFEALIKLVEADLITFPDWYDGKGYLSMLDVDTKTLERERKKLEEKYSKMDLSLSEYEEKVAEELDKLDVAKVKVRNLSPEEEASLGMIDLMKEQTLNIVRIKRDSGKDGFKLPPDKDAGVGGNMKDDAAYTLATLALYLSEKRTEKIRNKKQKSNKSIVDILPFRKPKEIKGMI